MGCHGRKRKMLSVLPEQRKAAFPKKSGQRFSSLLVCYFRLAKTTAPASVRTALNSIEKSTERLISISPMRHNCPNTMRKQASDGVKRFIASLLCRATAPTTTSGPFFVSEPRMAGDGCRGLGLPTKRPNRDRSELYWRQKGNAVIWGVASPLQSPKRPRMERAAEDAPNGTPSSSCLHDISRVGLAEQLERRGNK